MGVEALPGNHAAWRGVAAALCTCLLGLGLARFAYTPLIPALIAAHWFSPGQAVYLGAANIGGYLAGALAARPAARRAGVRAVLLLCMLAATASFFACAHQAGFGWFMLWRGVSGVAGAGLMVLAAPSVMPLVPPHHRGLAGGVIFTGIGIGIAASGTLLPVLLAGGVTHAWSVLGGAGAGVTLAAWVLLPQDRTGSVLPAPAPLTPALRRLCAAYATSAAGQVPAILFLADFVARGLHRGVAAGAGSWALFGLGALAGPLAAGLAADRVGTVNALRWLWIGQCAANLMLAWLAWTGQGGELLVPVAAAIAGAGIPGLVVLVLGRSQELAGASDAARGHAWSRATISFALGQASGAYALSFLFAQGAGYTVLFALGTAAMLAALLTGELSRADAVEQAATPASW